MKLVRTAAAFLILALPALACPRCKDGLVSGESDAWFLSIVGMIAAPFLLGASAFFYISRYGRKGAPPL
jgi:hypothetical protein